MTNTPTHSNAPAFTVAGENTGTVLAEGVSYEVAAFDWFESHTEAASLLLELAVGESWKSHPDARGIKITRVAS